MKDYSNLMNKEVLSIEVITNMIDKLHILLENNIDEIENKKIIFVNIFKFYPKCFVKKKCTDWCYLKVDKPY